MSFLADLGKTVAQAAPLLGSALLGPAGLAIGTLIANTFGGDINQPNDLIQRIQADPQAALKLAELQSNHELELQRLLMLGAEAQARAVLEEQANAVRDRDSARRREAALAQAGQRDLTPAVLAYLLTLGVFAALYYLFTHAVPIENKELIVGIISSLTTVWIGAMAYYHGSSAGSRLKDIQSAARTPMQGGGA